MNNLIEKYQDAVPAANLKAIEAELSNTSNMLRQILLDQENWGPGNEKMQYLVQEIDQNKDIANKLRDEVIKLKSEHTLQPSEEKDQNVVQLAQRLAAAEVNESIAIQKAEYTSKICNRLRDQKSELEQHIKELENSLTEQLSATFINEDGTQEKKEYSFVMQFTESQNAIIQEALTGAQQQISILKGIVDCNDTELESLRKLVAELQANSDLHSTIGRMGEEILTLRLNETNAKIDTKQAQLKCSQLSYHCHNLERQLQNEREMLAKFQECALTKERYNCCVR
ncbi:hypothetical protein B566_EDAN008104 [Ephemera danica]|nr:hypothetical protein B566_EDAN008104 [Ephemera danica]